MLHESLKTRTMMLCTMTAQPEITTSRIAPITVGEPTNENLIADTLPSLQWPINAAVLKNKHTRIIPSSSTEGPRLTIYIAPDSAFAVRSPINGTMQSIEQPDKTSIVILTPPDSSSFVVLENLQSVTPPRHDIEENKEIDPAAASEVQVGEIIGDYRASSQGFIVQVAHLACDPSTPNQSWELIDPIQTLPEFQ